MNKRQIGVMFHDSTVEAVDKVAHELHLSRTAVIQLAINDFLKKYQRPDRTTEERGVYTVKPGSS